MKKVVSFGDVMMRLSTPGHSRFGQVQNLKFGMLVLKQT
jgi:hypothetical protein